jgi:hypothetical protein
VNPTSTPALRRIWADATPLSKFIEDRAEQLCREAPAIPARKIHTTEQLSTIEGMTLMMEYQGNLSIARGNAMKETVNHLVAGRIVGLGRRSDSYDIEPIEASFWIGSDVGGDSVTRDARTIVDVRVVMPDVLPAAIEPKPQTGPGRPSAANLILEAIAYYAKTDPSLDEPRSKRFRAYRTYISQHGKDPITQDRFSDKTFEKYESEFRKKNR